MIWYRALQLYITKHGLWLSEATFVASFEVDDYVYFFFREIAKEVTDKRLIVSRVARVCKVSIKTMLQSNCGIPIFNHSSDPQCQITDNVFG